MSNRHPLIRMYHIIKNDKELLSLMNQSNPQIYTFEIPDDFQKKENAPFIRITEIRLHNTLFNDSDSNHYRFLFAVEVIAKTIQQTYEISERVNEIIKSKYGRCYDRDLSKDDFGLFNNMLEFEIILNEKENE
ncbi:hypothetical protein [Staphylococcus felis]|uniref:hypothetical protein n=1 Tax=Staphylococcus felis TaxID=46127 RepID=UPI000E2379A6|nr:hypothetical protein [Staphylococcus felis]REI31453.1 hypothetical protein DOS80_05945 [Staphylococcus felis]